jgi:phenylpropionate dioxygenase-like ring-hydroxylating dioxygenase large terminal subunit
MRVDATNADDVVSVERGEIDRRIYSDEEIFEQEMELIFGRAWLFLCHETQIRNPGDFFEAPMGRDNVLVVRQKDGSIKALLNTCAHRGNAVCRAEEGNAKSFLCTYHGWSYGIDGRLKGVPGMKNFYNGDLDKAAHGLREIAQLASYRGFVFGTHDPTAPPLDDYLGATGRLGIDLLAAKGAIEVVPGIQKFVINCNWKFAVDNLFDWYHPQVTHASAFTPGVFPGAPSVEVVGNPSVIDTGDVQMEGGGDLDIPVTTITGTTFDQVVVIGEYGHGIGGPTASSKASSSNFDYEWRKTPEAREALGPVGVQVAGHPNIFPTLWVTTTNQVSLRIPRDPQHTEIWWFTFAPVDAPPEVRQLLIGFANHVFGPAGLLEQDDGENWAQATMQTVGIASRRVPHVLKMGAGRGKVIKEHGLARIETTTNEHGQLWTYHAWAQWMKGLDWDSLRTSTTPPDIL